MRSVSMAAGQKVVDRDPLPRDLPRRSGDKSGRARPGPNSTGPALQVGALTETLVMLTTLPPACFIIPGRTACISAMGVQHVGVKRL